MLGCRVVLDRKSTPLTFFRQLAAQLQVPPGFSGGTGSTIHSDKTLFYELAKYSPSPNKFALKLSQNSLASRFRLQNALPQL